MKSGSVSGVKSAAAVLSGLLGNLRRSVASTGVLSLYRVVSTLGEGAASKQAADGHPTAPPQTFFLKGLDGVLAARGVKRALADQVGSNDDLVSPDHEYRELDQSALHLFSEIWLSFNWFWSGAEAR